MKCAWIFPDPKHLDRLNLGFSNNSECASQFRQTIKCPADETDSAASIQICNHGTTNYGRPWLSAWGKPELLEKWISINFPNRDTDLKSLSFAEIENWRIQAAQPQMDAEITESALPLEIGLRSAIADNKGCYPGQEVIEKIMALGSPAKRLVRIEGSGVSPQVGDRVQAIDPTTHQAGTEVGTVTTSSLPNTSTNSTSNSSSTSIFSVLAIVRKTHAMEGIEVRFQNHPQLRGTVVQVAPYE